MKKLIAITILLTSFQLMAKDKCNNYWSVISPDGNHIYFSSDRDGEGYEIYKADIDGTSNLMRLTNMPEANNIYPSVSPDGSKIAFQHGDYGSTAEIYIMNNDGTDIRQLTDNSGHDGFPNFSPDGRKIVFEAWDNSTYPEVFTMNLDGTERTQLTNEGGAIWQSAPIYNPSGTKIYFSAGFNADNYYVMMNLDGSNWVNVTDPNDFGISEWGLQFNVDGSKLIFYTTEWTGYNNGGDIVIADPDGANWNRLTNSMGGEYYYVGFFHPTNNKIYYSYYPGASGKWSINRMSLDGTDSEKISTCSGSGIDDDFETAKSLINPNPASNMITVSYKGELEIRIFDAIGRQIIQTTDKQINISELLQGLYLIELWDHKNQLIRTEKLLKQ